MLFRSIWVTFGQLEVSRDERARAAGYFEKALELDPNDYQANRLLGLIELRRSEFEAACEHLGRAAQAHYGFQMTELRGTPGICAVEPGRFDGAPRSASRHGHPLPLRPRRPLSSGGQGNLRW